MRLRAGPRSGFSCWERLYLQGAVWGRHTLTALPADAICPGPASLREAQTAVPRHVEQPPPGHIPRRWAANGPEGAEGPGRIVSCSAPAIPTAAGAMKVTAYGFESVLQKACMWVAPAIPQGHSWQKGDHEGPPRFVSTRTLVVCPGPVAAGRDLAFFSDFCLASALRM